MREAQANSCARKMVTAATSGRWAWLARGFLAVTGKSGFCQKRASSSRKDCSAQADLALGGDGSGLMSNERWWPPLCSPCLCPPSCHSLPESLYLGFPFLPAVHPKGDAPSSRWETRRHLSSWLHLFAIHGKCLPHPGRPGSGTSRLNVTKSVKQPGCEFFPMWGILMVGPTQVFPYPGWHLKSPEPEKCHLFHNGFGEGSPRGPLTKFSELHVQNKGRFEPRKHHINKWRKLYSLCCFGFFLFVCFLFFGGFFCVWVLFVCF